MARRGIAMIADVGESFGNYTFGNDEELMRLLSTTNVACGFHAGDPRTIDATIARCREFGLEVGAHPGYNDRVGFGRRRIEMTEDEIRTDILYQLGALSAFTKVHGVPISHVGAHGRLGSLSGSDETIARAIASAVEAFDPELIVIAGGVLERECAERGLTTAKIYLADRGHGDDGRTVWRDHPDALLHDPDEVGRRVVQLIETGTVRTVTGKDVPLGYSPDVILVHGDHPLAVENATAVRRALEAAEIPILGIREVIGAPAR